MVLRVLRNDRPKKLNKNLRYTLTYNGKKNSNKVDWKAVLGPAESQALQYGSFGEGQTQKFFCQFLVSLGEQGFMPGKEVLPE